MKEEKTAQPVLVIKSPDDYANVKKELIRLLTDDMANKKHRNHYNLCRTATVCMGMITEHAEKHFHFGGDEEQFMRVVCSPLLPEVILVKNNRMDRGNLKKITASNALTYQAVIERNAQQRYSVVTLAVFITE
ncbi:hypothetical protein KU75_06460 [Pectobacterium odoriferum]|uniref:Uncharacterized protein n=1 Tax=Pectobacterium odoriferum TaxID=78398 RepID=A0ABR4VSI8_9GAMM|nr:hypothetical protein [Pectobacterium odoriferum]KGA42347.1 hypothetical protein KU75_06460 [Pectobacterium odoriferum]